MTSCSPLSSGPEMLLLSTASLFLLVSLLTLYLSSLARLLLHHRPPPF